MNNENLMVLRALKRSDADVLLSAGNFERYKQLSEDLIAAIRGGLIKSDLNHLQFIFHARRPTSVAPEDFPS